MNRYPSLLVALCALLAAGCSFVTDFDRSRLEEARREAGQKDAGEPCGLDGGLSCDAVCGNNVMEPGETCDPPETCPSSCDDGTACTEDKLTGSVDKCNRACEFKEIPACQNSDQCCASGCTAANDLDCSTSCGNGEVEPGETCDPTSLCPTDCNDGNACTNDSTTGTIDNCNVACTYTLIARCVDADGCCPNNCNSTNDSDCTVSCGNGAVEPGETCDPPGSCPSTCEDGNACTINAMTGSIDNCNVACTSQVITRCQNGDGCCPGGCNANTDSDCTTTCNNQIIEPGETCDPPGSCPTSCNDGTACTIDSITGSPANCMVACRHQQVTQCQHSDGCCPAGCNANNDHDCSTTCNNSVVEPGETCDPPSSCVTNCNDGSACTIDTLTGSAANCTAACGHQTITQCKNNDGCCAPGCNNNTDKDCSVSCNNNVIEPGETCDPVSSCPASVAACNDGNACTVDALTGSAANCTAACTHQGVTQCQDGDGCCPAGCNNNTDKNCSASCGNGVVEAGETCDPRSSCPTTCNDGNSCTIDVVTGSNQNCNVACTRQTITQCTSGDGCCPGGCNANNDNNCSPSCGNGAVEMGETCDPPAFPCASCNDGNACTVDTATGSAASCTAACTHTIITQCANNDGCCASGCNANNDNNCSPSCGNGTIEMGEICDGNCPAPSTCTDTNTCTINGSSGSASMCNFQCTVQTITACLNSDGCCAPGCTAAMDNDCQGCGNGRVEAGETCDPPSSCPAPSSCTDSNACTINSSTGSAANCNIACVTQTINSCQNGDGCCLSTCTAASDNDCAGCGNGRIEAGETCDPPGSCPSCTDADPCTANTSTGSAATCNLVCGVSNITACGPSDMCCPGTCNISNDADCSRRCGDGVVTAPETCDPPAVACPASCPDDGDPCTSDTLAGSALTCDVACTHPPIVGCTPPDAGTDGG